MAYKSKTTITRPANTDAYIAGDVVGGAFLLKGLPINADLLITNIKFNIHVTGIPSGMTSFSLKLYDESPASALADNAPWDLPSADRVNYLTSIPLGSPADVGSTLTVVATQINEQIRSGSQGVWAYLVTTAGYTPSSEAVKTLDVHALDVDE
jgi:hypothetical protein